ncbi:LacI family DNA-binding transcriptional regulator [Actinokineospora bangkokensis]|uniref:LacI family transcriptional regulator n=1 Tax=Actinokineospora bangkokensis TaxID=1193682 RepID=A0A1Q9LK36_9PSEU|nr:LacI family DNA-binding transcriptional regulator [Actinokineospora bangkokensis]OLR92380.1 LacI family transcriptional regulator [Actinokineospora bangkokensis]
MGRAAPSRAGTAKRQPTLEDVARAAGVSRATASRVVNGTRNVDPHLRSRVDEAVLATGYRPNQAARALVTKRTDAVALVLSGAHDATPAQVFADPFFGRAAGGVVAALGETGRYPLLVHADTGAARSDVLTALAEGSLGGALIVSTHPADPLPVACAEAGLPAVTFARPARGAALPHVDLDHARGGALAAEHLLARGRRGLATITGPLDVRASRERLRGFQGVAGACAVTEGGFTPASGEAAMARLLLDHPGLDGVFAANDVMAEGALRTLAAAGRRVPEDVAVIGFDDSATARTTSPPLTTIRQPVEDMAAAMVTLLGEPPSRALLFDPVLVVRAST